MKEVHNRPAVIEKKRIAMTKLHNGDCIPCVEFQCNYELGRSHFRIDMKQRKIDMLAEYGIDGTHYSLKKMKIMINRLRYYIKRGEIDDSIRIIIKEGIEMETQEVIDLQDKKDKKVLDFYEERDNFNGTDGLEDEIQDEEIT